MPLISATINVAVAGGAVEQQQNQVIQQQQQRQQELQDKVERQQRNRQSIDVAPQSGADKTLGGPCFDIKAIKLNGSVALVLI